MSFRIKCCCSILTPTPTRALAYPNTRRDIRAKYKQPPVAQSEVARSRLDPPATISITQLLFPAQGRSQEIFGLLYDTTSKCWVLMRVICAPLFIQTWTYICTQAGIMFNINTRQFTYLHIIRSSSLLSLSPSRRIRVPVKLYFRHNPKQSSKVPLLLVSNCPDKEIVPTVCMDLSESGTCQASPI